jgi:hypothetical protein
MGQRDWYSLRYGADLIEWFSRLIKKPSVLGEFVFIGLSFLKHIYRETNVCADLLVKVISFRFFITLY